MRKTLSVLITILVAISASAQIPTIMVRDRGNEAKVNVVLESMTTNVEIFGNMATTKLQMTFYNPSDRLLEATLLLPLPEQASVTGFALDINGRMRPAVAVEKERATAVFESVERRRIDPGLLEKTVGNNFKLRIYPMPARGSRTVEIAFRQELRTQDGQVIYQMPMPEGKLKQFALTTTVYASAQKPKIEERPDGGFDFVRSGNVWQATITKENYRPTASLRVVLPPMDLPATTLIEPVGNGSYYFASMVKVDAERRDVASSPAVVSVIWDNSLSRLKADKEKEKALLRAYLKDKSCTVLLSTINIHQSAAREFLVREGDVEELMRSIDTLTYDGGTDLGRLVSPDADVCLLFSDGVSSFGEAIAPQANDKPIYTIASSAVANQSLLSYMSLRSAGLFINLSEIDLPEAVAMLNQRQLRFLGVGPHDEVREVYPLVRTAVHNGLILVTGISRDSSATLHLTFGYDDTPVQHVELNPSAPVRIAPSSVSLTSIVRRVAVNLSEVSSGADLHIAQLWAGQKVQALEYEAVKNRSALVELGKQFGVVSSASSLLVLETIEDYVKYGIAPPTDMLNDYRVRTEEKRRLKEKRQATMMSRAEAAAKNLKKWWATDWSKKTISTNNPPTPPPAPIVREAEDAPVFMVQESGRDERANAKSYLRTSSSKDAKAEAEAEPRGTFQEVKINSDANYMKPMEKVRTTDEGYSKYLTFRELFLSTPSYYLDMARWFFARGDKGRALRVLSCLSELGIENPQLYRTLAFELKKQKQYDKELFVCKELLRLRPFEIQSYRDCASALVDNERFQEALDTLYSGFKQDYTEEIMSWAVGMDEAIVMDLNGIIALGGKNLKTSHINRKLIANLPVDIRVVLNWNMDHTDIDLHVTDPMGETCYYGHQQTSRGGRLSGDITDGLGPEQFILRKARRGKYRIETNFFGERQITFAGPTTIMAEVYLYYATGKIERRIIVFESPQGSGLGDKVLIGTFEFR